MGKVNLFIKYCLINHKMEYNIYGILIDNKLKFKNLDSTMILNLELNILEKISKDRKIIFDFKKKICIIIEKEQKFSLALNVLKLVNKGNFFYVMYKIEDIYEIEINIK